MDLVFNVIFYMFTFLAVYVQVFFLYTYLERRKDIVVRLDDHPDRVYPSVTIIVPCWNEQNTVKGTMESLLALDYPKDKLHIILIDDGSTDGTLAVLKGYEAYENVRVIAKENGGKHTAMNLGIEKTDTEFIGCLDADSFVTPSALKRIIPYFDDPKVMAVSPSIIVDNPKRIMEWAQKIEYQLSVYVKKMLGLMNGIHVTPGPFSIYRLTVFQTLGPYREAHKTEDMEIAFRMHENGYRIEQCHDAVVHTRTPATPFALYKQRRRWIYGFINNTIDYRRVIFKSEYGAFSMFTIPAGIISICSAMFLFIYMVYTFAKFIAHKVVEIQAVGVQLPDVAKSVQQYSFDWFFVSSNSVFFVSILLYGFVILSIFIGSRMATGKFRLSFSMVWYIMIYSIIAPIWILSAVFNTITRRETAWR